jgi:hypothetical protein
LDATKPWRNLAIGVALIAAAVDIVGVLVNLTVLPELARGLTVTGGNSAYTLQVTFLAMEKLANNLTNIGGYGLYTLAGLLLLPAAFATSDFWRPLAWMGVVEWFISSIATILLVLAPNLAVAPLIISFALYAPWVWGGAWWLLQKRSSI